MWLVVVLFLYLSQQAPADSFIDCTAFEVLGLQQPFTVSVSSNVHLLMTFHSHLSSGEVAGYLGGRYSKESKSLEVLQAFPCQCDLTSSTEGPTTEREVLLLHENCDYQTLGKQHSYVPRRTFSRKNGLSWVGI
jgi:hypothetical protein